MRNETKNLPTAAVISDRQATGGSDMATSSSAGNAPASNQQDNPCSENCSKTCPGSGETGRPPRNLPVHAEIRPEKEETRRAGGGHDHSSHPQTPTQTNGPRNVEPHRLQFGGLPAPLLPHPRCFKGGGQAGSSRSDGTCPGPSVATKALAIPASWRRHVHVFCQDPYAWFADRGQRLHAVSIGILPGARTNGVCYTGTFNIDGFIYTVGASSIDGLYHEAMQKRCRHLQSIERHQQRKRARCAARYLQRYPLSELPVWLGPL